MEIKKIKFVDVVPDDYNPRINLTADDIDYQKTKASIQNFGYIEPMVYNEATRHMVGGHQRLMVLQALGYAEAEMSVVNMTDREEKLLNLRLNKIKGRWDYDKLSSIIKDFTEDEALLTGFGAEELAVLLADTDDFYDDEEDYYDGEEDYYDGNGNNENDTPHEDGYAETGGAGERGDNSTQTGTAGSTLVDGDGGGSWLVTLTFDSTEEAKMWCEGHGYPKAVKEGKRTTVIRIDEE